MLHHLDLELKSLDSVRKCAAFEALRLPLHILVVNAGAVFPLPTMSDGKSFLLTSEGLECHVGGNFVAHVLLAQLLWPQLGEVGGRMVVVSSRGHDLVKSGTHLREFLAAHPTFPALNPAAGMDIFKLYGLSKLGNLYHASAFAKRPVLPGANRVTCVSLHPGGVLTDIWRHIPVLSPDSFWGRLIRSSLLLIAKTNFEGALTSLRLCLCDAKELVNGGYYADEILFTPSPVAQDVTLERETMAFAETLIAKHPSAAS